MFIAVRRYKLVAGAYDDLEQRVQSEFVPMIRKAKGFSDYYWVRTSPDAFFTVSIFEERQQAEASNKLAADWLQKNHLGSKFIGNPEVFLGDAVFDAHSAEIRPEVGRPASPAQPPVH
jgi:heme-degrading monooxygenase HmoA